MPSSSTIERINELLAQMRARQSMQPGLELAALLVDHLKGVSLNLDIESIKDDKILPVVKLGNSKMGLWFKDHPYIQGPLTAFQIYEDEKFEAKFFHLRDRVAKRVVAGGVQLTPNWEDHPEEIRNVSWKVGVDYFLTSDCTALLMVVSMQGNLRVLQLEERLTSTQVEIIKKIAGAGSLLSHEAIHTTLWNALAIREVNRNFYQGIAEFFEELRIHLVATGHNSEDSKLFASRLLGRLLFVWFLRKKKLINEDVGYFITDGVNSSDYYNDLLKPLFFTTLSLPPSERGSTADLTTPYLNGGLFEIHENDWYDSRLAFPEGFFSRLYAHFDCFNFTTDESSPEYEQVAIDPEMLGRVFESLLATQITESGESARKAKGAFYTPREVVAFMCRESVREYLRSRIPEETFWPGIDRLIDATDAEVAKAHSNFTRDLWGKDGFKEIASRVIVAIDEVRILDPACGSGAFPLGMVQLLTRLLERLEPRLDAYKTKYRIIGSNIYGVDIEPMAIEIAKLRTWLSLIVDSPSSSVEPLPNLDFKYVCANSLVPLQSHHDSLDFGVDPEFDSKLASIRDDFFSTSSRSKKKKLQQRYYELIEPSITAEIDKKTRQLNSFDPFKYSRPSDFFEPEQMFGLDSFDIVIGNPPYKVLAGKDSQATLKELKAIPTYQYALGGRLNLYRHFIERSVQVLSRNGFLSFIVPSTLIADRNTSGLRRMFRDVGSLKFMIEFPEKEKIFESVTQATTIFLFSSKKSVGKFKLAIGLTSRNLDLKDAVSLDWSEVEDLFGPELTLPMIKSPSELDLIRKIKVGSFPLSKITSCWEGEMNQTFEKERMSDVDTGHIFVRGEHVTSYVVDLTTQKADRRWFKLKGPSQPSQLPRLVCQGVANMGLKRRLVVARVPAGVVLGNSLNYIDLPVDYSEKVLLALLNSSLINWFFRKQSTNNNVNVYELNALPIRSLSPQSELAIEMLVDEIDVVSSSGVIGGREQIEALMKQIDEIVFSDYGLDAEEILLVETT